MHVEIHSLGGLEDKHLYLLNHPIGPKFVRQDLTGVEAELTARELPVSLARAVVTSMYQHTELFL